MSILKELEQSLPAIQTGNGKSRETSNIEYTIQRTNITLFVLCIAYSMLLVSLGCPFVVCVACMLRRYIRHVLWLLNVISVSGLSICCLRCRYVKTLYSFFVLCTQCY
jgi:hypothetical protein